MKRNHLLGSILLTCVCLLAGSVSQEVVAQTNPTEGALLALNDKGESAGACPLKHTDVKTEISGSLARVTVTQQFQNPFPNKIEAVYTFPLPQAAAVDDMTIVIGDRTVKGKIMRREEAQATYDAAKARGQTAALLNQQRPNIFTQSVANILPSQQINVTISYVETLKYEDGAYEWSFPMVVGQRYIPGPESSAPSTAQANGEPAVSENARVPDAAQISPPVMPKGMRAGHDISIEVNIDAGVPLIALRSLTHEIEAVQPAAGKALVRLKDEATIPNKDFVVKYDVAGAQIEDALLFHRRNNDGFLTFILQPPQRFTVEDVTPKELVFVLDTSGSMGGFPIEKAKETMMLALEGLYPRDTFNVILFSGDTRILFSNPQPATPENINEAKKLVAGAKGMGGTEMMKAIRAALEPSDRSDHVRITCFMTDGQVGDDMEIISEVQKHPNARVFAMGFGDAPNRFLLDKITEYGRGEVEYVTGNGDSKLAAQRFHERVRNPLLTDVSIDWGGLPVSDVYPKKIPDLFTAKPVVISGRYAAAGKGVIRLKGMMSGREFVREIAVELPEQERQHDVLETLWARSKVDDLMGQDMAGAQRGQIRDDLKTEITNLGIAHRMMTQFTSFVAVDEQSPADGVAPERVDVPIESTQKIFPGSFGGITSTVTVMSSDTSIQTSSATMGSTVTQRTVSELPVNGRSLQSLYLMAPGAVSSGRQDAFSNLQLDVSVNGQRASANQFILDGVSGNFGISSGGQSPGASAGGGAPALTVTGDTSALAPFSAIQEVEIHTYSNTAEYGRNSGGTLSIVTKSGTNSFHGSVFELFGNRRLDANDWFANSRGLARPESGSNGFGGTFGGPIKRDRFFFFTSFEGLRLHQPVTSLTDVPSLSSRLTAPALMRQLLNLYPLPNGPGRPDGFAEFAASFANRARQDSAAAHLDLRASNRLSLTGYYNFTASNADERGAGAFSANTMDRLFNRSQIVTGRASFTPSPRVAGDIRINDSRLSARSSYRLDNFGGAILPAESVFSQSALFSQGGAFMTDLNGHNSTLFAGAEAANTQRQLNTLGSIMIVSGVHAIKFGVDYRRVFPTIALRQNETRVLFDGVAQAMTGLASRVGIFSHPQFQRPVFNDFATYAQDEWRLSPRLTLTYGMRWELDPAPSFTGGNGLLAVKDVSDPSGLSVANRPRLWATTYRNFAPRAGLAYQLNSDATFVVRGGFGVLYDNANKAVGDALADSYPSLTGASIFNIPFSFSPAPFSPGSSITVPFSAFDPSLQLPYSLQWNVSIERVIKRDQVISAAYVGSSNRRLLLTSTLANPAANFGLVRLTNNDGRSDSSSFQIQFRRRVSRRFGAMATYTWAKSRDNFSEDSASRALFRALDSQLERGPSDFDIRHTLTGFVSYDLPDPFSGGIGRALFRNWTINSVFSFHSASPVNVVYAVPTSFGFLYLRPDVIAGAPLYLADQSVAGGRRINPAAFTIPNNLRQGSLLRNALRGFPLAQVDLALRRRINFTESARLILGVEGTNIFNHPNFSSPDGSETSLGARFAPAAFSLNPTFGQSFTNAARSSWGAPGSTFGANYYPGGPRTLKLSARFEF